MKTTLPELLEHPPEGSCAYLLLDNSAYDGDWLARRPEGAPSRFAPLMRSLQRSRMACRAVWGDLDDPKQSAASALLIQWSAEENGLELLSHLLSARPGKCAISVLHSTEPLDTLVKRLHLRTQISLLGGDYVLRYFDTRILHELLPCLTPHQTQSFTSLALVWHYLDRDDQWQTLHRAEDLHDQDLPLELDDIQQDAVFRIGSTDRIDAALTQLVDNNPLESCSPGERYRWIRERQHDALSHRIVEHSGQLHFCLYALQEGEAFHQQPEWESAVQQLRSSQATA